MHHFKAVLMSALIAAVTVAVLTRIQFTKKLIAPTLP
jgi:hypothetical protein